MPLDEEERGSGSVTPLMVLREINALKELFEQRVSKIEESIRLAHDDAVQWPTKLDRLMTESKELVDIKLSVHVEKFAGIDRQFIERDIRTEQISRDSVKAIDAALQAAKEAVGKQQEANDRATSISAAATARLIDQQSELLGAAKSELGGRIDTLKEGVANLQTMIVRVQASTSGRVENVKDQRENIGMWVGAIALIVAIASVVISNGEKSISNAVNDGVTRSKSYDRK